MKNSELNFLDFLVTIVKWRKLIFFTVFFVTLLALIISLLLPKWYKSEAIILPPESQSISFGMGAMSDIASSFLGSSGYELPMLATRSDVFATILESRRMAETLIQRNELFEIYEKENLDLAIRAFKSHYKAEIGRDGSIFITFEAKEDPVLAAKVPNDAISYLNEINTELSQAKAKNTRMFLEKRLKESKQELIAAEEALKKFQQEHNTVNIEVQTENTIKGASELITKLVSLKVQKGVMSNNLDPSHTKMIEFDYQINELEKALQEIVDGPEEQDDKSKKSVTNEILVPLGDVPDLGLQTVRLMRELKIQEMIFELLTQQYEQFTFKEKEDTPSIQILQHASSPDYKSRPKRAIIVLISFLFACIVSVFLAFFLDFVEKTKTKEDEESKKFNWITAEIKKDFRFFNKKQ